MTGGRKTSKPTVQEALLGAKSIIEEFGHRQGGLGSIGAPVSVLLALSEAAGPNNDQVLLDAICDLRTDVGMIVRWEDSLPPKDSKAVVAKTLARISERRERDHTKFYVKRIDPTTQRPTDLLVQDVVTGGKRNHSRVQAVPLTEGKRP